MRDFSRDFSRDFPRDFPRDFSRGFLEGFVRREGGLLKGMGMDMERDMSVDWKRNVDVV